MKRYGIIMLYCLFFIATHTMDKANKKESSEDSDIILPIPDKPSLSASAPHMPIAQDQAFHLNLQNISHSEPSKGVSGSQQRTPKTPISNCNDLYQEIKRAKSVRTLPKRSVIVAAPIKPSNGTNGIPNDGETERKNNSPSSRKKKVPAEIIEKVENILGKKFIDGIPYYSENEVWEKIAIANPALYAIAQNNNMELDEAIEFAELVEKLDLGPQVFKQIAQGFPLDQISQNPSSLWQRMHRFIGDPEENLDKKWRGIRDKNPELYKMLQYNAIKEAMDHTEDKIKTSPIKDTHIDFQREEIKQLAISNNQQKLATLVTVILAIGGWVFGFVGQLVQPPNQTSN